jgi:hypothetical protein
VKWLRQARYEVAGAFRSLRYDLAKRSGPRHETTDILYPEYDAYEPDDRHRRAVTATGIGLVLAGAVAGVYFAVAGGMGVLLAYGSPGTPADRPAASASQSAADSPSDSPVPAAAPSDPHGVSPTPSPSPSRRPGRAPSRRPTPPASPSGPASPPAPSPTANSPSPTPQPSVTGSDSQTHSPALAGQP